MRNECILICEKLNEMGLMQLFNNKIIALIIPGYTIEKISNFLSDWLLKHPELEVHPHDLKRKNRIEHIDYGVDRVGVSYNTTFGKDKNSPEYKHYFDNALSNIREIRSACYPNIAPFDQLRLELDENWSFGASIANFEGKKNACWNFKDYASPRKIIYGRNTTPF